MTVALTQRAIDIGNAELPSGSLIVPLVVEVGGAPVNVQLIDGQGSKRYSAGGQKAGAFHHITGGPVAAVGEGYATGLRLSTCKRELASTVRWMPGTCWLLPNMCGKW